MSMSKGCCIRKAYGVDQVREKFKVIQGGGLEEGIKIKNFSGYFRKQESGGGKPRGAGVPVTSQSRIPLVSFT